MSAPGPGPNGAAREVRDKNTPRSTYFDGPELTAVGWVRDGDGAIRVHIGRHPGALQHQRTAVQERGTGEFARSWARASRRTSTGMAALDKYHRDGVERSPSSAETCAGSIVVTRDPLDRPRSGRHHRKANSVTAG